MNKLTMPLLLLLSSFMPVTFGAPAESVGAQSMTVLGGDASARDCFRAASVAARRDRADGAGVAACNRALLRSRLTDRDRLATFVNRGILHLALRDLDAAASDFDAAIAMDPVSGEVYVDRGNLAYMRRDYAAAITDYTRALELGLGLDHVAHFNRGMAFEHLRRLDEAGADYRRAAELAPDWRQPRLRLEVLAVFAAARGP